VARSCQHDGVPLRSMKGAECLGESSCHYSSARSHSLDPELLQTRLCIELDLNIKIIVCGALRLYRHKSLTCTMPKHAFTV